MSSEDTSNPEPPPETPQALRAVAHPTRVRILEMLGERPSMTATQCAALLHLSAKTCSYHLTTLGAAGLIEEVPVPGRNRPWRLAPTGARRSPAGADRTQRVRARREAALLDGAAEAVSAAGEQWGTASAVHVRVATMSPAEVLAWVEEVERVTSRHVRKAAGAPGSDGGRAGVALLFCGYPTPEKPTG